MIFENNCHLEIAQLIEEVKKSNWIISYDDAEEIKDMYSQYRQKVYSLNYSAGTAAKGSEVIIFDNHLLIPNIGNPTNKAEIKKYYAEHYV